MNDNLINRDSLRMEQLCSHTSTAIDRVPQIPLYMDQVLSYLDSTLVQLKRTPDEPVFTKTMINNYVKAGVLKAPKNKKYNSDQLAVLTMLYRLKGILQIKDVEVLFSGLHDSDIEHYYAHFLKAEQKANTRMHQIMPAVEEANEEELKQILMALVVEADAQKRLVEAVIDQIVDRKHKSKPTSKKEGKA